jgi:hypothetical protein
VGVGVPVGVSLTELVTAALDVAKSLARGLGDTGLDTDVAAVLEALALARMIALNEGVERALPLSAPRAVREGDGGDEADGTSEGSESAVAFEDTDKTPGALTVAVFSRAARDG